MKLHEVYMRDPFFYVEDGVGYLVGTTDENAWGGPARGFLGYRTADMVHFDGPYSLFENTSDFWAEENFWAPELHKYQGKYYLFASFKKQGRPRASQALVCDTPFGRYTPCGAPFTPREWECLDATLFVEDGKPYTVFCHEWQQCKDGTFCLGELSEDFTALKGKPVELFAASSVPWTVPLQGENYVSDGPFLFRLKSGKLLMLFSSFGKEGYAMGMAVSEKSVKGPWKLLEDPLFRADGGHGMAFRREGRVYVTLHCPNEPHLAERPRVYAVEEQDDRFILKGTV